MCNFDKNNKIIPVVFLTVVSLGLTEQLIDKHKNDDEPVKTANINLQVSAYSGYTGTASEASTNLLNGTLLP